MQTLARCGGASPMKPGDRNPNHACPQCGELGVTLVLAAGLPVSMTVSVPGRELGTKEQVDIGFTSSDVWICRCTWSGSSADLERPHQARSEACLRPLACRCPACQALHGEVQACLADDRRRGSRNGGGSGGKRAEKPGDKVGGADQQRIADWEEDQRRRRVSNGDPKSVVINVPGARATSEEWELAALLVAREAADELFGPRSDPSEHLVNLRSVPVGCGLGVSSDGGLCWDCREMQRARKMGADL